VGYGAWRFDDAHASLHDRLTTVLASLEPTSAVTRQLGTLMTMVTLQSVDLDVGSRLAHNGIRRAADIWARDGQPEYQIEIHLGRTDALTLDALNAALAEPKRLLAVPALLAAK